MKTENTKLLESLREAAVKAAVEYDLENPNDGSEMRGSGYVYFNISARSSFAKDMNAANIGTRPAIGGGRTFTETDFLPNNLWGKYSDVERDEAIMEAVSEVMNENGFNTFVRARML